MTYNITSSRSRVVDLIVNEDGANYIRVATGLQEGGKQHTLIFPVEAVIPGEGFLTSPTLPADGGRARMAYKTTGLREAK